MSRKAANQAVAGVPARVEFDLRIERSPKGRRREKADAGHGVDTAPTIPPATAEGSTGPVAPSSAVPDVPRATQVLVVAYWFERLIDSGKVKDYAEIARLTGLSRARITQIADLRLTEGRVLENYRLTVDAGRN